MKSDQDPQTMDKLSQEEKTTDDNQPSKASHFLAGVLVAIIILAILLIGFAFVFRFTHRPFFGPRERIPMGYYYRGYRGFRGGRGFVFQNTISGKVTAVNGQTLTIDVNGQTKTVQISDATRFPIGSATKVNVGDQIVVWGSQDSQGVIQATQIAVNP